MATYNYELKLPQNTGQFTTGSYGVFHECSFNKDVVISSLFWYRGATGTNPVVYPRIYSGTGVLLGTGSEVTESTGVANSWYKVNLNSPVTLKKNTSYYIGFYFSGNTPLGYYSSQSFPQNFSTEDGRVEVKLISTKQNANDAFPTVNNTTTRICIGFSIGYYEETRKILLLSEGKVYSAISYDPIDVIPTMTSNTAPSGTVSASSASTSGTEYRVFDKNKTNTWLTTSGQKTGWIQYKFPSMARVNRYGITPQSNALTRSPKKWSLLGSNTGLFNGEEVVLDSRINETSWSAETKYFDFNNNSEYQYYRLSIEENNGDTSYVGFNELEFLQRADMKLVKLSSPSEKNFIQYGSSTVQFGNLTSMVDVNDSGRDLGSGQAFEHTIDLSKRRVDKITLG
jgi:hypothetical protein